ncbi:hypothetical protein [Ruegeria jejuensis]|uniref:hypothetical protein n=1 Tax=Ruegeria jejuensis TaxID=3233338 RepID=UPI00355AFDF6
MKRFVLSIGLIALAGCAQAQSWSQMLDLGDHGNLHVVPFTEYLGSDAPLLRNGQRCGFRIGEGAAARWVVTVGEGSTEMMSCDALLEFGTVGPDRNMIGAIYRFRPTPRSSYVGPLVLRLDGDQWVVDDSLLETLANRQSSVETLADLNDVLSQ